VNSSRALLFHNPVAGRKSLERRDLSRIVGRLEKIGYRTSICLANGREESKLRSSLAGVELLIISGGDGTIHDLLPAVVEASVPIAILPIGTANVFARELGIPRNPEGALRVIQTGRKKTVRLGSADGRYFHLMAGIGVDGYIIQKVGPDAKKRLGIVAFWIAGLSRFWKYPLRRFQVQIDETIYDATFAVISNTRFYGGNLQITPRASVFDGMLDVCLFRSRNHLSYLRYLYGVITGRHLQFPDIVYRKSAYVRVIPYDGLACQLDGEPLSSLPLNYEVASESIEILTPS